MIRLRIIERSRFEHMLSFRDVFGPLLEVALDLCANVAADDRYRRLAAAVRRMVPCDAMTLLRLDGDTLVPVVADGLRADALARRFAPAEHPRLAELLRSRTPVRFHDATMPDPFDGLLAVDSDALAHPHACMGCAVIVGDDVMGVLTLDALTATAFDRIDDETVAILAALAGAALRTSGLIEALERVAARDRMVARQLVRDAILRGGGELLGTSAEMNRIRAEIAVVAASDLTALITGETGVGKELVAHAIHSQSRRAEAPLIHVNCAALPEAIAESELFGHVKGSFTGAAEHRAGKFEIADGGTLFLDEIGELPHAIQPKLLRALQSGEVQRVGSDRTLHVDVRVIAATNRDLPEEVRAGRFRSDLYHRLLVFPLHVAPLRDRRDDIPLLAGYFLDIARIRLGLGQLRLTPTASARLAAADWPGNVRELEHVLQRAALRAWGGKAHKTIVIDDSHLGLDPVPAPTQTSAATTTAGSRLTHGSLREAVDDYTRELILSVVDECDGNWAEAARRLGLQRGNLHRLATRLGLGPTQRRDRASLA